MEKGLHHIDQTTMQTQQSVEQMKAMMKEVVSATRGQTRLLMDLCSDAVECPRLVWMAQEQQSGLVKFFTP